MRTAISIETGVTENDEVKEGKELAPALILARQHSARWVDEAVGVYEVAKIAAGHIGVKEPYLNYQRSGRKPFNLAQAALMRIGNLRAFQRLVESMAVDARMVVIPRAELELEAGEAQTLRATKKILGAMWASYRDQLCAVRWRCTGDLLEMALMLDAEMGK